MALTESQIQELYVAYFGRPADVEGKAYWSGSSTGISTVLGFAANMHSQSEFQDLYGSKETATQVNEIYQNLFSRDADAAGLEYWTGQIGNGTLKLAEIAVHLIYAAKNNSGSESDKTALENKVAAAKAFTNDVADDATAQLAYTADDANAFSTAKTFISTITTTAATAAQIDTQVAQVVSDYTGVSGTTYTLTTGSDAITGTDSNDTIKGVMSSTATLNTFSSLDTLAAGKGTDTFNLTLLTDGGAATTHTFPTTTITGIETFEVKNQDADSNQAFSIDFGAISGVTTFRSNLSTEKISTTNMESTAIEVVGNGGAAGASADLAIGYGSTITSSTVTYKDGVDAGDLTVTGTGITSQTIKSTGSQNDIDAITLAATTTSTTIDATTAFVTGGALDLGATTTLTITGAGNVDLDAATLDTTTDVVDASAATGNVDISTGAVAANTAATGATITDVVDMTVTTGSGDDKVTVDTTSGNEVSVSTGAGNDEVVINRAVVAASNTKVADVLNGGAGTDILSMDTSTVNGHAAVTTITNFEELTISDANANDIVLSNLLDSTSFNTVNAAAGVTTNSDITFTTGSVGILNIQAPNAGAYTIQMAGDGTSDEVKLVNEDEAADAFADQNVTATGIETLTIVTTGTGDATAQTIGTIGGVSTGTGVTATTTNLTVKFEGTNQITTDILTVNHVDASAMTGNFIQSAAMVGTGTASSGVINSLKGGSGNDTLKGDADSKTDIYGNAGNDGITGGTKAETISGGAGNDTIAGGGGADTITGGAGNDTITMGGTLETVDAGAGDDTVTAAGNLTAGITVKGGAGTDILEINAAETAGAAGTASEFETLHISANNFTQDLDAFTNNTFTTVLIGGTTTTVSSIRDEVICADTALGGTFTGTIEADDSSTTTTVALKVKGSSAIDFAADFAIANTEILNIESDNSNTVITSGIAHTINLDIDTGTTLNITGDAGLIIQNDSNDYDLVTTVDASGMVLGATTYAGLTWVQDTDGNTAGSANTVTGSNGIDTLTGGVLVTDTFSGGAGADVFNYTGGNDVYTGGAGADVYHYASGAVTDNGTQTVHLTIADFATGDSIDFTNCVVTSNLATDTDGLGSAISLASTSTLLNYLDNAASGDGNTSAGILKWFQYSGDTYIVIDNTAGGTFAATDSVTKLTGLVDLSNSTVGASDDVLTMV